MDWDNHSGWKQDDDTFLFSLSDNKVFRKKEKSYDSIYCGKNTGPWFPFIGMRDSGKYNMSQGEFLYGGTYFNNFSEIIKNDKRDRFFDVLEVEVYKIEYTN